MKINGMKLLSVIRGHFESRLTNDLADIHKGQECVVGSTES